MTQVSKETLEELEKILIKKNKIVKQLERIPKTLSEKNEELEKFKRDLEKHIKERDAIKKGLSGDKIEIERLIEDKEKYEKEITIISNQKEYEAIQKQIRSAEEREKIYRKRIQKNEEDLGRIQETISKENLLIEDQEEEVLEEEQKMNSIIIEQKKSLKELEKDEKAITKNMNENIYFKFQRIVNGNSGKGISTLIAGACSGCNIIVSIKFLNTLKENQDKIHFCPYCSRMIFYDNKSSHDKYMDIKFSNEESKDIDGNEDFDDDDNYIDEGLLVDGIDFDDPEFDDNDE